VATDTFELPSGKHAGSENFPVASRLVRAELRPHLVVFYGFARAIDDIADAPGVAGGEKRHRLAAFDAVLAGEAGDGPHKAVALRRSLEATGVDPVHARELIRAFILDTEKTRYADWDELMAYCRLSAAPVGRHILALHGEDPALFAANDALCNALQVINHLQDCADDYRALDRVYLPEPWLAAEGLGVDVLAAPASPPGLRRVLDRSLDRTDDLLERSRSFARKVKDTRLSLEIAAIQALAEGLCAKLRREDPLRRRVTFSKPRMALVGLGAAAAAWRARRR
jgi:hydroxysqualene synthase